MDRKKIIYIGIISILTVIFSITYFSYAFFIHSDEQPGKLNIVTGTLDYKLTSSLINNNAITLAANEKARLYLKIKSTNTINSKYELYYSTNNNNIEIGYMTDNNLPTGTINANDTKIVTVIIKNKTNSSATVTFGVQGGFINNTLTLSTGRLALSQYQGSYCEVANNTTYSFLYNGSNGTDGTTQEFNIPCTGNYKLETWGAQGGTTTNDGGIGGYGGYSTGNINLSGDEKLYINVGGKGQEAVEKATVYYGGYNGGGPAQSMENGDCVNQVASGGGATHIAKVTGVLLNLESNINDIIIVSGGGGGANYISNGGSGGGITGNDGTGDPSYATGGTQLEGGIDRNNWNAMFGGASGANYEVGSIANGTYFCGAGGGGGYYGGARGFYMASTSAGGGSGYIGNVKLTNKAMYCYDCQEDNNESTYTVSTYGTTTHVQERDTVKCENGYSSSAISKCAKAGNGYARITFLSESLTEEKVRIVAN